MEEILKELKNLSDAYERRANNLCIPDGEEDFYADSDDAVSDGRGQAFWEAHIDLENLIKKYIK